MNIDAMIYWQQVTDHYKNYSLMQINLLTVKEKDLTTLLLASWNLRAPFSVKKKVTGVSND